MTGSEKTAYFVPDFKIELLDVKGRVAQSNMTLGRALDPRANGTWLSKLNESNKE